MKTVIIDGNDGTGKTFLKEQLEKFFPTIKIQDRGIFTKATDLDITISNFSELIPIDKSTLYIIVDDSVENCQKRILSRGDSIEEKYHTIEDLTFYGERFRLLYDFAIGNGYKDNVFLLERKNEREDIECLVNVIHNFNFS